MAGWKVYAESYNSDSELGTKTVKTKFNKNIALRHTRCTVVFFNDPPITNLRMEIYSDDNGSKGQLLHTSDNTLTKAQMITDDYGIKEIYFTFSDIGLHSDQWYHFALNGTASGMSASSHIAWKHGWPDNVYRTGLANDFEELMESPYDLYFIGAEI